LGFAQKNGGAPPEIEPTVPGFAYAVPSIVDMTLEDVFLQTEAASR
jgi:hypothetical protein